MQAGGLQRGLEQAQLGSAYEQFMREQNFPLTGLNALATAASGIPAGLGTVTQSTSGLGPALGAIGAFGMGFPGFGNMPIFNPLFGGPGLGLPSDARLKENVQKVGSRNGVNLYTWDWNDTAKSIGADKYPATGVIAQEVEAKYPQHVVRDANGFRRVNYVGLYSELEAN